MKEDKKLTLKKFGQILLATIGGFAIGYFIMWMIPNDFGDASFSAVPIVLFIFSLLIYFIY